MIKLFKIVIFVGAVLLFTGCEDGQKHGKVHFDRDVCEHCKMVISDDKFSTEIAVEGKNYYFDDLGCLVGYVLAQGKEEWLKSGEIWINDAKSGEFIDAKNAHYYAGFNTPMGFGWAAFKQPQAQGAGLNFTQVVEKIKAKGHIHSDMQSSGAHTGSNLMEHGAHDMQNPAMQGADAVKIDKTQASDAQTQNADTANAHGVINLAPHDYTSGQSHSPDLNGTYGLDDTRKVK